MSWFLIALWTMQPVAGPFYTLSECEEMRALYATGKARISTTETRCTLMSQPSMKR